MADLKLTWKRCENAPPDWYEFHAETDNYYLLKVWFDSYGDWSAGIIKLPCGDRFRVDVNASCIEDAQSRLEDYYFKNCGEGELLNG